jgi:hypothetical protein
VSSPSSLFVITPHRQIDTPSWDTKTECSCGQRYASRCEMWSHQSEAYLSLLDHLALVLTEHDKAGGA